MEDDSLVDPTIRARDDFPADPAALLFRLLDAAPVYALPTPVPV
jgi:hypothetical protein